VIGRELSVGATLRNMSAATTNIISLDEYLHNPRYRHAEYISGEVVQLNVGTGGHSRVQGNLAYLINSHLKQTKQGSLYAELHCRLKIAGKVRFRLPDVAVISGPAIEGYYEGAPELCIEIRSPEDTTQSQIAKFDDYFANGCKLGWLILPDEEKILILRPGQSIQTAKPGERLECKELFPGLSIAVDEIFG